MGVDAQNPKAVEHLFQIKKRALNKPLPILLPSKKDLSHYCEEISPVAQALIQAFWPGPLTLILKCDKFPKGVSHNGTVGFKVSGHPLVQNLLLKYKRPITTTSANISDKESPEDPMDFFRIFPKDSFVLIQEIKPSKPAPPSTIVDCTGNDWKIVREGQITAEDIEEVLRG